ncbi:hypothetical protein EJA97_00035 [Pseudomonas aeruginosa]|nr:hypothetical protein [Pseudomonas aeruginosa]AZN11796.1 hypothetical protein EJA97_00035 [Pseudomonas aeruginosa]
MAIAEAQREAPRRGQRSQYSVEHHADRTGSSSVQFLTTIRWSHRRRSMKAQVLHHLLRSKLLGLDEVELRPPASGIAMKRTRSLTCTALMDGRVEVTAIE